MTQHCPNRAAQAGFTLIELMIALMLGLLVVGAAGSLFLSNQRVYGSTETLSRIQENQRSAFEILARDIREAGANPCIRFTTTVRPVLQLVAPDTAFWAAFADGIRGGDNEITLYAASTSYPVTLHKTPAAVVTVNTTAGLANGQALMICNTDYAIAFSASGISSTTIGHNSAANCATATGFTHTPGTPCTAASAGPGYCFWLGAAPTAADTTNCPGGIGQSPAYVAVPTSARWTVAANGRGGSSLYRTVGGVASEIAEGVNSLQITYKIGNAANYVAAASVSNWQQVTSVRLQMSFQAAEGTLSRSQTQGTDNAAITRTLDGYIMLRNHQNIQ